MERQLPQNVDVEQCLLGCIILDPVAIELVADTLSPDDFYRDAHQIIYEAALALAARRCPPDFITLCDELERLDKLTSAGGASYITSLVNMVPTSGNIEYYAGIVAKKAVLRRLISAAGTIAAAAYAQDDNAVEIAEQLIMSIEQRTAARSFATMPEMVAEYWEYLNTLHESKGKLTGVTTGYAGIDSATGGLQKGDVILLAARPSIGKTSLGLCIAYSAALAGKSVAIFSLEMGRMQLLMRLTAMATKVNMQRLRTGWIFDEEWPKITDTMGNLSELKIYVDDTAGNPIASMQKQLRKHIRTHGPVDLVVVDYLGLIEPEEARNDNRVQEVSKISRGLMQMARKFNVPVLALSQLSRAVESRGDKHPGLADLRDSGSLEQDASVVMFIYREDYYRQNEEGYTPTNVAEVTIAKQRNGPTGTIKLYFKPDETMFYPLEAVHQ